MRATPHPRITPVRAGPELRRRRGSLGTAEGGRWRPRDPRSIWDKFDDNVRGADTADDPFSGRSQRSNLEKSRWTDGYGNYVDTNDPNYNPSADNPGDWQLMQESK